MTAKKFQIRKRFNITCYVCCGCWARSSEKLWFPHFSVEMILEGVDSSGMDHILWQLVAVMYHSLTGRSFLTTSSGFLCLSAWLTVSCDVTVASMWCEEVAAF